MCPPDPFSPPNFNLRVYDYTLVHTRTHKHTHVHTHAHKHIHVNTHTYTDTRTYTHVEGEGWVLLVRPDVLEVHRQPCFMVFGPPYFAVFT